MLQPYIPQLTLKYFLGMDSGMMQQGPGIQQLQQGPGIQQLQQQQQQQMIGGGNLPMTSGNLAMAGGTMTMANGKR